jgi:hypothetical protein
MAIAFEFTTKPAYTAITNGFECIAAFVVTLSNGEKYQEKQMYSLVPTTLATAEAALLTKVKARAIALEDELLGVKVPPTEPTAAAVIGTTYDATKAGLVIVSK